MVEACTAYTAYTAEVIPFQGLTVNLPAKPKPFEQLCEAYKNKCAYCGRELPLTRDHKTPLAKGGSNSMDNIVPACKECNTAKGDKTYDEFTRFPFVPNGIHPNHL